MNTISPDDPRLTAYVLGELDETERADVEALLQNSPAAQAAVEEIRATAVQLEAALGEEPLPEVSAPKDPYREKPGKLLSFPKLYFVVGTLAAACFAVVVVLHEPVQKPVAKEYETFAVALPAAIDASVSDADQSASSAAMAETDIADQAFDVQQMMSLKREALMAQEKAARQHVLMEETRALRAINTGKSGAPVASGGYAVPLSAKAAFHVTGSWIDGGRPLLALPAPQPLNFNTENYAHTPETGFIRVADQPLSTFSVDVDTASYANVRRFLNADRLPPPDAVRIEELLNYFPYHYVQPTGMTPFAATLEVANAPWAPEHRLVRIGLKGREIATAARPPANLVFLIDVSGSMNTPNRLPLVKEAMRLLVERLRPDDRVAIVTYAGNAGLALPSTPARKASEILAAVDALQASGSTNGEMGIQLAYDIAKANLVADGINRVILCTDGDFNVGVSDDGSLTRLIEEKAKSGVFLSVLGFGMGNYQDAKLELLADRGNGNYGYIDSKREAEKLLVEQINGTLVTIAKDVKLQVEFNPATVQRYRLIGYENRRLQKEDFVNDQVDAGEIGAGHTVTALYEIVPTKGGILAPADDLKYQKVAIDLTGSRELLTVKVRYKGPGGDTSQLLEFPLADDGATFATASTDFKFAASVTGFGMLLRNSQFKGTATWSDVQSWAEAGRGGDAGGYRDEFIRLIGKARQLSE